MAEKRKRAETHFISARDLHENPIKIRYWLTRGDDIVLTYRGKAIAYIRPYDEEGDFPSRGPDFKEVGDPLLAPEHMRTFMTMNDIRNNMSDFLFGLQDGLEFIIGHYHTPLGIATPDIPDHALSARGIKGHAPISRWK